SVTSTVCSWTPSNVRAWDLSEDFSERIDDLIRLLTAQNQRRQESQYQVPRRQGQHSVFLQALEHRCNSPLELNPDHHSLTADAADLRVVQVAESLQQILAHV